METKEMQMVVLPKAELIRPIVGPADLVAAHKELTEIIRLALEEGRDYGVIPGTQGGKKTLLKPGAERLAIAFGTYPRYETIDSEIDHDRESRWTKRKYGKEVSGTSQGLYRYVIKCSLVRRQDQIEVADGIGSCSTLESKYIDRPRDMENTVLKMAQKRALVAAVLNAFGLSDRFSQDLEDLVDEDQPPSQSQPSRDSPREQKKASLSDRAGSACGWFKALKIDILELEQFIGTKDAPIPVSDWGEDDLKKLSLAKDMITAIPEKDHPGRVAKAAEIFKVGK